MNDNITPQIIIDDSIVDSPFDMDFCSLLAKELEKYIQEVLFLNIPLNRPQKGRCNIGCT